MTRINIKKTVYLVAPAILVFLLKDPILYLSDPNRSLYLESGWKSASSDRTKRIDFLLWYGADPNKVDDDRGYTPLHTAAHWGNTKVIDQLLANGANPNIRVLKTEITALDLACKYGSRTAVDVLIKYGTESIENTDNCKYQNET